MRGQPTTWTVPGSLAHAHDALGRLRVGREMHVRELRHRVADALVDRAADLAAHRVRDRDVHVGRGDRRRHRLEAIADADDDVGLEHARRRVGSSMQPEARGLRHRRRRLALDDHRDLRVGA